MNTNENSQGLCGPILAEAFECEYAENYVKSNTGDVREDKYISNVLGTNRTVLSGVRGTGKTMILKVAHEILEKEISYNAEEGMKLDVLPIYISFSGFKEEVSLQDKMSLTSEEATAAKEIFRSYLFISLLQQILAEIEKIKLDETLDFNFFGIRAKLGIKREVDKAVREIRIKGFKELTENKKKGIGLNIQVIGQKFSPTGEKESSGKVILMNEMQKVDLFKDTIESICRTYKFSRIHFFFDEVYYLNYLQGSFFDALFGFRNFKRIDFTISSYPTFMDYGEAFDIPDDAKEVSVTNQLYKPSREIYEKPLIQMISDRILKFQGKKYSKVIDDDALKRLILIFNGNPRMLMQGIDYLWVANNNNKISLSMINQTSIAEMENDWYRDFLSKQAKRYKTNIDKVNDFLGVILDRIADFNKRNDNVTIYFALTNDIEQKYSETINLLLYSRFIERIKVTSLGGSSIAKKAKLYLVTPIILWSYGAFPNKSIRDLEEQIKYSTEKDSKVQFASLEAFESKMQNKSINSCPRNEDGQCIDPRCGNSFSEEWTLCPYYSGLSLIRTTMSSKDVDITELKVLTVRMKEILQENGIKTIHDILVRKIEGLMQIKYIKSVRARNIYFAAIEYCDDNI